MNRDFDYTPQQSSGILCLGSIMVDIICPVDDLPLSGQGVVAKSVSAVLGGCAFNTAHAAQLAGARVGLLSPIGQGIFASFIERELAKYHLEGIVAEEKADNGAVMCLVQPDGERTMVTLPGIERSENVQWLLSADTSGFGMIEVCGYEIEGKSGDALLGFLESHRELDCWFAPGPSVMRISDERMERILALGANWHLNAQEAKACTGCQTVEQAGCELARCTQAVVVITDGACGSHAFTQDAHLFAPATPASVIDTTSAGDSHLGGLLAKLSLDASWEEALDFANKMGAAACQVIGSLPPEMPVLDC